MYPWGYISSQSRFAVSLIVPHIVPHIVPQKPTKMGIWWSGSVRVIVPRRMVMTLCLIFGQTAVI